MHLFPISALGKSFQWFFQTGFFSFGGQLKWSLVALDRWSFYTVTNVQEFAWADSALVSLNEWSNYRGGPLNRFDCIIGTSLANVGKASFPKRDKLEENCKRKPIQKSDCTHVNAKYIYAFVKP